MDWNMPPLRGWDGLGSSFCKHAAPAELEHRATSWARSDGKAQLLRVNELRTVYAEVARYIVKELPEGKEPLRPDEFRCFSCGYEIHRTADNFKLRGWTWK